MSENWLKDISNDAVINNLAIPGTHDSAAWTHYFNLPGLPATWAHRKSIKEQLHMGVRALDLRVGFTTQSSYIPTPFYIGMYHGPVYLDSSLDQVLATISKFLHENPTEFLILTFQDQGKGNTDGLGHEVYKLVHRMLKDKIWDMDSMDEDWQWPKLQDVRGKVVLMNRMDERLEGFIDVRPWKDVGKNTEGTEISLVGDSMPVEDDLLVYVQDKYTGFTVFYKNACKEKFALAQKASQVIGKLDSRYFSFNHLSFSNPCCQPWYTGSLMNTAYIQKQFKVKGVLVIDDANPETVEAIFALNS